MNKELIQEADKKLNKAILSFFNEGKDFWTLLGTQFKRVPVPGANTITTRITEKGVELLYDPELVLKSQSEVLRYHIVHESLHLVYRHAYRFAVSQDVVDLKSLKRKVATTAHPQLPIKSSDAAADLIVNRDASDVLGRDVVAELGITADMPVFKPLGYANTNSSYTYSEGKSMFNLQSEDLDEQIVNTYTEVQMPSGAGGSAASPSDGDGDGGGGQGSGQGDDNDQGKGNNPPPKGKLSDKVGGKQVNRHLTVDAENPLQKQLGQHFVEDMIKNAAKQIGKGKGDLPASVQEELEAISHPPKKDWKAILSNYVQASIPAQSLKTWAKLHRVFPYVRKGKKKRRVPLIGVVQDTSGSVSDAAIAAFYRELDSIRKITQSDIELVQCDADIKDPVTISYKKPMKWSVEGRGGTEYLPALEYFDKAKRTPDVVVFFTDLEVGDSDVPAEPRKYKIIWVSVNKEQCDHFAGLNKYGVFIHLDVDSLDEEAVSRGADSGQY